MIVWRRLLILTLIFALLTAPVLAGTKYMAGSPDLSAALAGANEFSPGAMVTLTINIQNSGLNEMKFVQSSIVNRDDQPNTAKLVNAALSPGGSPLIVKSDPQMIGDILGGATVPVQFTVKVPPDAPAGEYQIPLDVRYTYLFDAEQYGTDSINYRYKTTNETLLIPVMIKPVVSLEVRDAVPEHLNAGTEGYLNLKVRNSGYEEGKSSVVKIVRNGNSLIIPVDGSAYVGNFTPGGVVEVRFKVSVAGEAEAQSYPLDVMVVYENHEGETVSSDPVTIGVPVGGKIDFAVVQAVQSISPGSKKVLSITFRNTGDAVAHSAQARMSAVDPFTSSDDTAFLGDLNPGDEATARFDVSVDKAATLKDYGLDTEVRYRDSLENSRISDTMKVRVSVVPKTGLDSLLGNTILLSVIVAAAIGAGYYLLIHRKKGAKEN
jgi:hypothetical protein